MSNLALVLDVDGSFRTITVENDDQSYKEMRAAIGGYLEAVRVADDLIMYCDEEGLLKPDMVLNQSVWLLFGRRILGTVVIVGDDGTPETAGLSDKWVEHFQSFDAWPDEEA